MLQPRLQERPITIQDIFLAKFRHEQRCRRCATGGLCRMGEELEHLTVTVGIAGNEVTLAA